MRTFVAIGLPDGLRQRLGELVSDLRAARAEARWVDPASMHLTLKFLGDTKPDEITAIDRILGQVAGEFPASRARVRGVGSFPHLRRPRVIWVGLEPEGSVLASLQGQIDDGLTDLGFRREKRRFHPHLTLGRVKGAKGLDALRTAVEARSDLDLGTMALGEVRLYESHLSPRGARYTVLGSYRLRGNGAGGKATS